MALGLQTESGGGGDFTPIVKFDARAGRMFRVDRTQDGGGQWQTENVEITNGFQAVFDLENIEVGWFLFAAGVQPQSETVKIGQALPARPNDQFKQGFRLLMKLGKDLGGDVREIAATSKAVIGAMDELHSAYEADKAANAGKLPVVALKGSKAIVSTGKGQSSTNYAPIFEIVKWVGRPPELGGEGGAIREEPKPEPVKQPEPVAAGDSEEF